jgi:hypothetical protein
VFGFVKVPLTAMEAPVLVVCAPSLPVIMTLFVAGELLFIEILKTPVLPEETAVSQTKKRSL